MGPRRDRPSFVLVHGGFHTARCWDRLLPLLDGDAVAVDLPRQAKGGPADVRLTAWVGAVTDAIDSLEPVPVVLVGHSLAGLVLPAAAAARRTLVAHVALVAAVIPRRGSTQRQNLPWTGRLAARLQERGGVIQPPPRALAKRLFCNDMDPSTAAKTLDGLVPEVASVFDEPVAQPLLAGVPTTYVRLRRDRAVPPRMAGRQVSHLGGSPNLAEIDAGHDVMISRPEELAGLLNAGLLRRPGSK